jgi:hypothetical protein
LSSKYRLILVGVILILAIVGAAGSYLLMNRPAIQQTTAIASSSVVTSNFLTSSSTTLPSTTAELRLIDLSNIGSNDSYLTLLDAKGVSPYIDLARDLRKLPDLSNATAVAQISLLALNAANPETREAFELVIKGGTANPADFSYSIPKYNTELEVLYWLASSRHLKYDDTLALAIALSNGIWVTIGDESVKLEVKSDVVGLLDFFRETDGLQQILGYPRLEQLPLEAKIALAWIGANSGTHGPHAITGSQSKHDSLNHRMNLAGYQWDNVDLTTLRQMRDYMRQKGWVTSSIDQTVANLEEYFYFSGFSEHFEYVVSRNTTVQVNGETVPVRNMDNANFNFQYYLKNGKAIGVCEDEMVLVSAFSKSWGIATLPMDAYWPLGDWYEGHGYTMYYGSSEAWKVYPFQIGIVFSLAQDAYITLPPLLQNEFVPKGRTAPREAAVPYPFESGEVNTKMFAPMYNITGSYLNSFKRGVATDQMKQWILYKIRPSIPTIIFTTWNPPASWAEIQDGSQDLISSQNRVVGDLDQPYVDLTKLSYSYSNGSLFFRFNLHGKMPSQSTSHVSSIWYQVLLDVDSDSTTGYKWSSDFAPDYMLQLDVEYDASTNTASVSVELREHCGGSSDFCWASVGFTQHYGRTPLVLGGVGQDFFVLTCDYQDILASSGSAIRFMARSGIMYDNQVYNDYVPDSGTVSLSLQ